MAHELLGVVFQVCVVARIGEVCSKVSLTNWSYVDVHPFCLLMRYGPPLSFLRNLVGGLSFIISVGSSLSLCVSEAIYNSVSRDRL